MASTTAPECVDVVLGVLPSKGSVAGETKDEADRSSGSYAFSRYIVYQLCFDKGPKAMPNM